MKKGSSLLKWLVTTLVSVTGVLAFIVMFFQDKFNDNIIINIRLLCIITAGIIIVISLLTTTIRYNHKKNADREKEKDQIKFAPVQNMMIPSGPSGRIRLYLKYNSIFRTGMLVTICKVEVANEMSISTPIAMGVVEIAVPEEPMQVYFHCNSPHCDENDRKLLREGNVDLVRKLYIQPIAYKEHMSI